MFCVGQKVVCVDVSGWDAGDRNRFSYPHANVVYTIRDIEVDGTDGSTCIRLYEITNRNGFDVETWEFCEPKFLSERFRPVVERKTDIAIFKKMLTPSLEKELAAS